MKMLSFCFSLRLFLLLPQFFVMFSISSAVLPQYTPEDNILLNCGVPTKTTSNDGRGWDTDIPYISNTSTTSSMQSEPAPSVDQTPYSTARIFHSKFTYKIRVSKAGQKFVRFYFYPTNYSNRFDMTASFFSVHAAGHTLLSNFSAFLNLQRPSLTLVKEYIITVDQSRLLELTFTPSPSSYAFVNAIEVVSIPDKLYIKGVGTENSIEMVGQDTSFSVDDSFALENLYRLNVGGGDISSTNDSGMFRSWGKDEHYLLGPNIGSIPMIRIPTEYTDTTPPYTAPEDVYSTARTLDYESYSSNMTWSCEVDSGFSYLLRLYFCEYRVEITTFNQVKFNIFIHNQTTKKIIDIIELTGGRGVPVYTDYVVLVSDKADGTKTDL